MGEFALMVFLYVVVPCVLLGGLTKGLEALFRWRCRCAGLPVRPRGRRAA